MKIKPLVLPSLKTGKTYFFPSLKTKGLIESALKTTQIYNVRLEVWLTVYEGVYGLAVRVRSGEPGLVIVQERVRSQQTDSSDS
jgi:hypothetical protein